MALQVPSTRRARIVRLIVLLLAAAGFIVSMPGAAQAGDNGSWAVTPTPPDVATPTPRDYFVLEGTPGSVIKDQVRITNFTDKPITFQLYGADAYNTAQGGFFALQGLDEPQVDVGAWVTLPVTKLTVAPRTQADAPVRIRIPENATPGDHVGGIVALEHRRRGHPEARQRRDRDPARGRGPDLPARRRPDPGRDDGGRRPAHRAPRTCCRGRATGRRWSPTRSRTPGTCARAPTSTSCSRGCSAASWTVRRPQGVVDLLPGQKVTLTQKMSGIGHLDHVTATVSVATPEGATDHASTSVWVIPWLLIVALVLLLRRAVLVLAAPPDEGAHGPGPGRAGSEDHRAERLMTSG